MGVAKKILYELKTVFRVIFSNYKKQMIMLLQKPIDSVKHWHLWKKYKFQKKNLIKSTKNISSNNSMNCIQHKKRLFKRNYWRNFQNFTKNLTYKRFNNNKNKSNQNYTWNQSFMINKEKISKNHSNLECNGRLRMLRNGQITWL